MKHKNVVIRSRDNVDLLDPRIKKAFNTVDQKKQIPVYYQFCQGKDPVLETDPSKFIGKAFNVHEDSNGDIVCDVITNDALKLTENFQGIIDNFLVSIEPDQYGNMIPTLKQLLIYDAGFKKMIDEQRQQIAAARTSAPVAGDVAVPREGENPITPEVMDECMRGFHEEMGEGVSVTMEDQSDLMKGVDENAETE